MSQEAVGLFPRIRNKAALGMLALGFGVGAIESQVAQAQPVSPTGLEIIQDRSERQDQIKLVVADSFYAGKDKVYVERQQGFELKNTPYNLSNFHKAVDTVRDFTKELPQYGVGFIYYEPNNVNQAYQFVLPVKLVLDSGKEHDFVFVKDFEALKTLFKEQNLGQPPDAPALTVRTKDFNVSFLSPIGDKQKNNFHPKINLNYMGLQTEVCNSFLKFELTKRARELMEEVTMPAKVKKDLMHDLGDVLCNSYAVLVASKQAGLTYQQYRKIVDGKYFPQSLTGPFDIPYIYFPKSTYTKLGS